MLTSPARRLVAVLAAAGLTVAALIAVSAATAAGSRTLYRNFCPVAPDQVQAAGPYTVSAGTAS
jgi:hypothetical protein